MHSPSLNLLVGLTKYLDADDNECAAADAVWVQRGNLRTSKDRPPEVLVDGVWVDAKSYLEVDRHVAASLPPTEPPPAG